MKMKWFWIIVTITVSFFLFQSYALAAEWKPNIKFFQFGTGPAGGVWYPMGAVVTEAMNKKLSPLRASVVPGGSLSNLTKVDRNELQMAFSQLYSESLAWHGKGGFKGALNNIRHLISIDASRLTVVVKADSGINKIKDLKDKKIVVGQKGFMSELLIRMVLEASGITYEQIIANGGLISYLTYREGVNLLQDGHADAAVILAAHPAALLTGLVTQTKIKILPIDKEIRKKILSTTKGLVEDTEPYAPGTYGLDEVAPTISAPYGFAIHKDISEELAYRILEIIYDNKDDMKSVGCRGCGKLNAGNLDKGASIPLHPGAEKYLKEHRK